MATIIETVTSTGPQMDTLHFKLQAKSSLQMAPHPPMGPRRRGKLILDPQRALEPARKKLSTLEAQRIMAVLMETIKRVDLVAALPFIMENLDRFNVVLGTDLVRLLEDHRVIVQSFEELKGQADSLRQKELDAAQAQADQDPDGEGHISEEENEEEGEEEELENEDNNETAEEQPEAASLLGSRPASVTSISSQAENAMRNLLLVARQMQFSCKNILRAFSLNPTALTTILKDHQEKSEGTEDLVDQMTDLKEILMNMLLTTPVEETERNQYLKEISERERYNSGVIVKLEGELQVSMEDKDNEIRKKNDVIRRLQADLHQIEKFSEEHIRRTKSEAEKQEAADNKNSEGKKIKLQQDMTQLKTQLQNVVLEHRESEQNLKKKKVPTATLR